MMWEEASMRLCPLRSGCSRRTVERRLPAGDRTQGDTHMTHAEDVPERVRRHPCRSTLLVTAFMRSPCPRVGQVSFPVHPRQPDTNHERGSGGWTRLR